MPVADRSGAALRRCPVCGAVVARRALTCYMCEAALSRRRVPTPRIRWPRLILRLPQLLDRDKDRRCPICGTRIGLTAQECVMCEAHLTPHTQHKRSIVASLIPDLLLFVLVVLVVGIVTLDWWWRPQRIESSAYTLSPTSTLLAVSTSNPTTIPLPIATLIPSATNRPVSPPTATSVHTAISTATTTRIPSATPSAVPTTTQVPPLPTFTLTPTSLIAAGPLPSRVHVVAQGDNPNRIALQYGLDLQALMLANPGLDPRRLRIGQEITIPAPGLGGETTILSGSRIITYTVRAGDTLLRIAGKYNTSLNDIYTLNPSVSPQFLREGQVLHIGLGPPTPTPTATQPPTATPLPYPAPVLLWPADGEEFQGSEMDIVLQWTSVGVLAEEEWYVVRLLHTTREVEHRTKVSSWRVPSGEYPGIDGSPLFRWDVVIKRLDSVEGEELISLPSDTRNFVWR